MTMATQPPQKQGKQKASNHGQQKEVTIIMKCCCMLTTLVCLLGAHRVNKKNYEVPSKNLTGCEIGMETDWSRSRLGAIGAGLSC